MNLFIIWSVRPRNELLMKLKATTLNSIDALIEDKILTISICHLDSSIFLVSNFVYLFLSIFFNKISVSSTFQNNKFFGEVQGILL